MSKAAKSSPSPSAGGPIFGSLPKAPGFLRRNRASAGGKRDDDDSGPLGTDSGGTIGSDEGPSRSPTVGQDGDSSPSKTPQSPFGTLDLHEALSTTTDPTGGQDLEPDMSQQPRRGSEVSNSSLSIAPSSPGGKANHRNSLSSFASSTGSPLATGSSGGTTIGDLSTMSMPLLRNGGEERYAWNGSGTSQRSDGHSLAPSSSTRPYNASTTSISDTSSVHSYPPAPRPRTGTTGSRGSSAEGSADNWKAWASGMGNGKRRQSSDGWSYGNDSNRSPALHNVPRRASAVSFSMSSSNRTSTMPLVVGNPFAPLRKRLARSIGTGKSVALELQLIVELVDALDHFIETFSTDPTGPAAQLPENGVEVINEVSTLLRELIEIAPDAQRCLHDGAYGPLYGSSPVLSQIRTSTLFDNGQAGWWPRRLVRDCRVILEEIKIATRMAATARLPTLKSDEGDCGASPVGDNVDGVEWTLARLDEGGGEEEGAGEPKISAERRAKLLDEGQKRWHAYRMRQGLVANETVKESEGSEL